MAEDGRGLDPTKVHVSWFEMDAELLAEEGEDKNALNEDTLRDRMKARLMSVFSPVVGGEDKIVRIDVLRGKYPYAFIKFADEAGAQTALTLTGKKFPELGTKEIKVALSKPPAEPEPKPVKGDKGDPGKDSDPAEVAAKLKADPAFMAAVKGDPARTADVAAILKADTAFAESLKGKPGEDAKPVDVAQALFGNKSFHDLVRGKPGDPGKPGDKGDPGDPAPKKPVVLAVLVAIAALIVGIVALYSSCGVKNKADKAQSTAAAAQATADNAAMNAVNAGKAAHDATDTATAAQQAISDLRQALHGEIADAVKNGNAGIEQRLGAVEEALKPRPETPATPTPPATPPAPAATAAPQRMTGAVIVRDRFHQIEVKLDSVERGLDETCAHFCSGAGPHDPARCAECRATTHQ